MDRSRACITFKNAPITASNFQTQFVDRNLNDPFPNPCTFRRLMMVRYFILLIPARTQSYTPLNYERRRRGLWAASKMNARPQIVRSRGLAAKNNAFLSRATRKLITGTFTIWCSCPARLSSRSPVYRRWRQRSDASTKTAFVAAAAAADR